MNESLDIIYSDNHQLVVNKPAGLLTQPSGTSQNSLEDLAKQWVKETAQKPGNVFLHAVHRLDKPVSGIVLFARTSKALTRLNAAMRDKKSHKYYLAIVEGELNASEGTLQHYLVHDDFQARLAQPQEPEAKLARLHYRTLKIADGLSLIEIELETGRYHQIRVQLAAVGHPIIGDHKYGSHDHFQEEAIALHHYKLEVPHPVTGVLQTFEAPLPKSWPMH